MAKVEFDKLENELGTFYDTIKNSDKNVSNNNLKDPTRLIELLSEYREDRIDIFMEFLEENYELYDKMKILNFIKENPKMVDFLYEFTSLLKKRFPNTTYKLRYEFDVEIEDYDCLYLNILCDFQMNDRTEIIEKLFKFDSEIYPIKKHYDVINKFVVDVESI